MYCKLQPGRVANCSSRSVTETSIPLPIHYSTGTWAASSARHHSTSTSTSSSSSSASTSRYAASPHVHWLSTNRKTINRFSRVFATPGGLGDEELDVAVFRFTLGIPGFDDSNIPRVIGAAVAALVAINHVLGGDPAPPAQVRAEFLDITLAVLCFVAPEIEQRLRQVGPGRGRAGAGRVAGASQLFALAEGLPDAAKKELAWSSFALLKNVNCCSVLLLQPDTQSALLARGAVASSSVAPGNNKASLKNISQGLSSALLKAASTSQQQQWLPDRSALQSSGLLGSGCIPEGVESAVLQAVPGGGAQLLVLAERPRALSDKDRKWVAAIAAKLGGCLQQ